MTKIMSNMQWLDHKPNKFHKKCPCSYHPKIERKKEVIKIKKAVTVFYIERKEISFAFF